MSSPVVLRSAQPRYMLMAQRIADDIAAGRYPVGSYLPPESDLSRHFSVSRHTVREALRQIQSLGLIASRQGRGTRVVAREPSRHYVQTLGSVEDLLQYAEHTQLTQVTACEVVAEGSLADDIGCAPGQKFQRLEAVRTMRVSGCGHRPVAWTQIYIADTFAGVCKEVGRYRGAIAHLIEQRYGERIMELRQEIRAAAIDPAIAAHLEATPGSPSLDVRRWYIGRDGAPFEYTVSIHPADRYTFSTRLQYEPG